MISILFLPLLCLSSVSATFTSPIADVRWRKGDNHTVSWNVNEHTPCTPDGPACYRTATLRGNNDDHNNLGFSQVLVDKVHVGQGEFHFFVPTFVSSGRYMVCLVAAAGQDDLCSDNFFIEAPHPVGKYMEYTYEFQFFHGDFDSLSPYLNYDRRTRLFGQVWMKAVYAGSDPIWRPLFVDRAGSETPERYSPSLFIYRDGVLGAATSLRFSMYVDTHHTRSITAAPELPTDLNTLTYIGEVKTPHLFTGCAETVWNYLDPLAFKGKQGNLQTVDHREDPPGVVVWGCRYVAVVKRPVQHDVVGIGDPYPITWEPSVFPARGGPSEFANDHDPFTVDIALYQNDQDMTVGHIIVPVLSIARNVPVSHGVYQWEVPHFMNHSTSEDRCYNTDFLIVITYNSKHNPARALSGDFKFDESSCTDGVQNGREEAVDCGGSCAECAQPSIWPDWLTERLVVSSALLIAIVVGVTVCIAKKWYTRCWLLKRGYQAVGNGFHSGENGQPLRSDEGTELDLRDKHATYTIVDTSNPDVSLDTFDKDLEREEEEFNAAHAAMQAQQTYAAALRARQQQQQQQHTETGSLEDPSERAAVHALAATLAGADVPPEGAPSSSSLSSSSASPAAFGGVAVSLSVSSTSSSSPSGGFAAGGTPLPLSPAPLLPPPPSHTASVSTSSASSSSSSSGFHSDDIDHGRPRPRSGSVPEDPYADSAEQQSHKAKPKQPPAQKTFRSSRRSVRRSNGAAAAAAHDQNDAVQGAADAAGTLDDTENTGNDPDLDLDALNQAEVDGPRTPKDGALRDSLLSPSPLRGAFPDSDF